MTLVTLFKCLVAGFPMRLTGQVNPIRHCRDTANVTKSETEHTKDLMYNTNQLNK